MKFKISYLIKVRSGLGKGQEKVRWSGGQVKVKSQKFSEKSMTLVDSKLVRVFELVFMDVCTKVRRLLLLLTFVPSPCL